MYGIPNMKLEKWVIDRKIDIMRQEGISFVTNADVGRGLRANKLMKEYDRIILACGAEIPGTSTSPAGMPKAFISRWTF